MKNSLISLVANWTIISLHPSRKSGKEASEYEHRYHSSGAGACVKMSLTVRDGTDVGLTGVGIYFIRTSTKRTLGYARALHNNVSTSSESYFQSN